MNCSERVALGLKRHRILVLPACFTMTDEIGDLLVGELHSFSKVSMMNDLKLVELTVKQGDFSGRATGMKKTIFVFVSSTFTDTMEERNVLQEKILPRLRALCKEHGIEYIFFDMRYGVRDENTLDHQTWLGCLG